MEQCAYIAASRIGRSGHLLTGSLDSLAFAQPTRVGDIMYVTAQVRLSGAPTLAKMVKLQISGRLRLCPALAVRDAIQRSAWAAGKGFPYAAGWARVLVLPTWTEVRCPSIAAMLEV